MNINMYVINAILILMVVRQVREHPLDLRSLAVPVLAVGCAAVLFLHSVPAGGNDVVLELTCVLVGGNRMQEQDCGAAHGEHGDG